ncbi:hypothetical protein BCV70DRAFT_97333 [Testicularia cyperi]|uniref:Hemerythrin-like domain-containing protein n=1 Tax=Testicularia cyperi TaxID=1882483 RepID=A0A317XQI4_9BASI|nr:hypothetical protein BCV70DRAFT_97333 [Testicularia cyperi]
MVANDPWDCLYEGMLPFHEHFRATLNQIRMLLPSTDAASGSKNRAQTLTAVLSLSHRLCRSLEAHHMIEEQFIFPKLSAKLPQFAPSSQHTSEHETMHHALESLQSEVERLALQLRKGKTKDRELDNYYDYADFNSRLKILAETLLPHLEAEEKSLRAESVKAAGFKLNEIQGLIR